MLRIEGVAKAYGDRPVLRSVDLEAADRTTLAVIGPSGCGKSTLLRIVIGLVRPDRGQVRIAGVAMEPGTAPSLRRRIGYVIQEGGLFPHLTATRNVTLMAEHLGWVPERISARLDELCDLVRMAPDQLRRYPGELSGGQRQRVALMRGLFLDPDLLLLDEPLAALDPIIRATLQDDLLGIFERLSKTVLLVTHDMGEAAYLADEIALLRDGALVQRGTFEDLRDRPADGFVTEFIRAQRPPDLRDGRDG